MNNSNTGFFYEHIGHMQFSILTLRTFQALQEISGSTIGTYIEWERASNFIEKSGFSKRQAEGELERFCYGYECLDRFGDKGIREIALTKLGMNFLRYLIEESPYQSCQIALLVRAAKRKEHFNVTIQETTFFPSPVYQTIKDFNFRAGGAREFMKCIRKNDLFRFLNLTCPLLKLPVNEKPSLEKTIQMVESFGKYWASVGSRYSWFVFPQIFSLPFNALDWSLYDLLVSKLIRPPEWGGGFAISFAELAKLLEGEERLNAFWHNGIVRPVWHSKKLNEADFCLTSPGYLMWERKKKGYLYEFRIRRKDKNLFEIALCNATDFPLHIASQLGFHKDTTIPTFRMTGTLDDIQNYIPKFLY